MRERERERERGEREREYTLVKRNLKEGVWEFAIYLLCFSNLKKFPFKDFLKRNQMSSNQFFFQDFIFI